MAEIKDLIIGGASNYTWDQLKYWVNSIKKSGFTGDVILVGTNYKKETIDKLTDAGVQLSLYGKVQENGDIVSEPNGAPHVERFFYLWNALNNSKIHYRFVITTDTRDVIFQKNPSDWLENNLVMHSMVCSSEGMRYKNEPWGNTNLLQAFGPFFHDKLKDNYIYNVGTIAGDFNLIKGLMLLIFQMSINRPIHVVDQAVFNFLIDTPPFKQDCFLTHNADSWAIQLGTTEKAIEAGSGDIGKIYGSDPSKKMLYKLHYEDNQPVITDDGLVKNISGQEYVIVHQYDRIPDLKQKIQKKYGDN
jgi:hypothetical protein